MRSWARSPTAISACISRPATRNGATPPPTVSSPSRPSGCAGAAAASPRSPPPRSGCRGRQDDESVIDEELRAAARHVLDACRAQNLKLAVAESCTGGLLAAALTEIPGSSDVLDRGFVTYSNAAKQAMLGVPASVLETRGAVSKETVEAMAAGALERSGADLSAAVTGVAGPGGGTAQKTGRSRAFRGGAPRGPPASPR